MSNTVESDESKLSGSRNEINTEKQNDVVEKINEVNDDGKGRKEDGKENDATVISDEKKDDGKGRKEDGNNNGNLIESKKIDLKSTVNDGINVPTVEPSDERLEPSVSKIVVSATGKNAPQAIMEKRQNGRQSEDSSEDIDITIKGNSNNNNKRDGNINLK